MATLTSSAPAVAHFNKKKISKQGLNEPAKMCNRKCTENDNMTLKISDWFSCNEVQWRGIPGVDSSYGLRIVQQVM